METFDEAKVQAVWQRVMAGRQGASPKMAPQSALPVQLLELIQKTKEQAAGCRHLVKLAPGVAGRILMSLGQKSDHLAQQLQTAYYVRTCQKVRPVPMPQLCEKNLAAGLRRQYESALLLCALYDRAAEEEGQMVLLFSRLVDEQRQLSGQLFALLCRLLHPDT